MMESIPFSIQFCEFLPNKYSYVITVTIKTQNRFDYPQGFLIHLELMAGWL